MLDNNNHHHNHNHDNDNCHNPFSTPLPSAFRLPGSELSKITRLLFQTKNTTRHSIAAYYNGDINIVTEKRTYSVLNYSNQLCHYR